MLGGRLVGSIAGSTIRGSAQVRITVNGRSEKPAACTLRNWLGMWSLRHAQTRAEPHLARIDCPALVINAEQDTGVYPSDAQRIYDALAGADKSQWAIDTDHYFTTPGARSEKADTIAKWIAKRWR